MTTKLWIPLAFAGVVAAQAPQGRVQMAEQKRLAERALQRVTADVERLVDTRLRHDLGLITGLDQDLVHVEGEVTTRSMDRMRRELRDLQAQNDVLAGEYDRRYNALAGLQQQVGADAASPVASGPFLQRPSSGAATLPPTPVASGDVVATPASPQTGTDAVPAAPGGEVQPASITRDDLGPLALGPIKHHMQGSDDHHRVGKALYRAGQGLVDRAETLRRHGRADAARLLEEQAGERLTCAIVALEPVTSGEDAQLASLFYLSRCRELMFRIGERNGELSLEKSRREFQQRSQAVRRMFLDLATKAKDSKAPDAKLWHEAANTALKDFDWMNLHASYDVTDKIAELTWWGEK